MPFDLSAFPDQPKEPGERDRDPLDVLANFPDLAPEDVAPPLGELGPKGSGYHLRQGEEPSYWDKFWTRALRDTDEDRAKAANSVGIAEQIGASPSMVYEHYDAMTSELGLRDQPTNKESFEMLMTAGLPVLGGFAGIPRLIMGVAGFMALGEAESYAISKFQGREYRFGEQRGLAQLVPDYTSDDVKTWLDFVDFTAKAYALGAIHAGGKALNRQGRAVHQAILEKWFRDMNVQYSLPRDVYISAAQVRAFATGETVPTPEGTTVRLADIELTPFEVEALRDLGLSTQEFKLAAKYGLDVKIPAEKLTRITDRPWWGRFKQAVRMSPYDETKLDIAGKPTERLHVKGLLEEPVPSAETIQARRADAGVAAGKLAEDVLINDETLGQLETRILAGNEGVAEELASVLTEQGVSTFQDWLNPAKIGARIYQRLRAQGSSREEATAQIMPHIGGYTELYNDAIAKKRLPEAEAPPLTREQFIQQVRQEGSEIPYTKEVEIEGVEGPQTVTKEIGAALRDVERDSSAYRNLLECLQAL